MVDLYTNFERPTDLTCVAKIDGLNYGGPTDN